MLVQKFKNLINRGKKWVHLLSKFKIWKQKISSLKRIVDCSNIEPVHYMSKDRIEFEKERKMTSSLQ